MAIRDLIKQHLFGIHFPKEYLPVAKESFGDAFKVNWLDEKGSFIADATSCHSLLGYKPVLIAINKVIEKSPERSMLSFTYNETAVALLKLEQVKDIPIDGKGLHFYRVASGYHRFISPIRQWLNSTLLKSKSNPLSDLKSFSNHYQQVRIAYSIPRTVATVTVSDGNLFNLFPLDLHSKLSENIYAFTLREHSKSSKQVEQLQKVVLSEINIHSGNVISSTAKNHIKELKAFDNFLFSGLGSEELSLPLPKGCIQYFELELFYMKNFGFHRMYFFRIIHEQKVSQNPATYTHIHRYTAEWRRKNKISTVYQL